MVQRNEDWDDYVAITDDWGDEVSAGECTTRRFPAHVDFRVSSATKPVRIPVADARWFAMSILRVCDQIDEEQ